MRNGEGEKGEEKKGEMLFDSIQLKKRSPMMPLIGEIREE